jgi:hypothetical protein
MIGRIVLTAVLCLGTLIYIQHTQISKLKKDLSLLVSELEEHKKKREALVKLLE